MVVTISAIAGTLLSLGFSFIPKLREKFEEYSKEKKQLVLLGLLALASAGLFGVTCLNPPFSTGISCTVDGAWNTVIGFVMAVIANQSVYNATKHVADKVFNGE